MTSFSGRNVPTSVLINFARDLFHAAGVPDQAAIDCAEALVRADARGVDSHGLSRLPVYLDRIAAGGTDPTAVPQIEHALGGTAVVNGKDGLGLIVGRFAMTHAVDLARTYGVGAVTVRRSGHFGPASEFALIGPPRQCIAISTTNVNVSMAPFGGIASILGNNPLSIAAPTSGHPFVLDMALSTVARGKIRLSAARGEPLPQGWALDAQGVPTTDPHVALSGLITPMGGPKGSGLSIAIDILSALLSGASTSPDVRPQSDLGHPQDVGHFFLALHVPAFVDYSAYLQRVDSMLNLIRTSTPALGVERVLAPGDLEAAKEAQAAITGIRLQDSTWQALTSAAARLKVAVPEL